MVGGMATAQEVVARVGHPLGIAETPLVEVPVALAAAPVAAGATVEAAEGDSVPEVRTRPWKRHRGWLPKPHPSHLPPTAMQVGMVAMRRPPVEGDS